MQFITVCFLVTLTFNWNVDASSNSTSNTTDPVEDSSSNSTSNTTDPVEDSSSNSTSNTTDPDNCTIVEVNGYLHQQCGWDYDSWDRVTPKYKCPRSDLKYRSFDSDGENACNLTQFDERCPEDPGFYQVCGHDGCTGYREVGGTPVLCGTFTCTMHDNDFKGLYLAGAYVASLATCAGNYSNLFSCEGDLNWNDTCDEDSRMKVMFECDGICDLIYCEDESYCNGVQYGVRCQTFTWLHVSF